MNDMTEIPVIQPIAQESIDQMRESVARLATLAKREWNIDFASEDKDRLSFLDGQKAAVEFGATGAIGSGYIAWDDDKGWQAMIIKAPGRLHASCIDEGEELCTFRDALDAFMQEAARLA